MDSPKEVALLLEGTTMEVPLILAEEASADQLPSWEASTAFLEMDSKVSFACCYPRIRLCPFLCCPSLASAVFNAGSI